MSVISVNRIDEGDQSGLTRDGRTAQLMWAVVVSSTDTAVVAEQASGIPSIGQSHPDDIYRYCTNISSARVSYGAVESIFHVTATYSTVPYEAQPDNPLAARPQYSWSHIRVEGIIDVDVDGNAIVNSAGMPYDPPVTALRDIHAVMRVTRNEAVYNEALALSFVGKVNSATYRGYAPGYVMVNDINASSAEANVGGQTIQYAVVNYELEFSPTPFQISVLDAGFYEWDNTTDRPKPITDEYGNPISSPALLDGNGLKAPYGDTGTFNAHNIFYSVNFGLLNI